ncbi:hypothetical protein ANN_23987 [Periplaneta americana]|uniref:Uncharacterized protein n=1 Tax=Periplaneta americana TaxID=6978 RepID=A0ABQ8S1T6_PERAM|nr:hypothetical protein ANN_23987 [Periplaneta americana]
MRVIIEKILSSSLLSKNLKVRIYKTVILPVVLYGCETWILTLREEHRLRVFENKVRRKIFGAKRDKVIGDWRNLHNTELHALYSSPDIIRNIKSRRLRWAGHVARMGESRNAYRVLIGRPEGKKPLGRQRRRWEDNIKMDLREMGYDDRDWINLAQDRDRWRAYMRAAMNLRILPKRAEMKALLQIDQSLKSYKKNEALPLQKELIRHFRYDLLRIPMFGSDLTKKLAEMKALPKKSEMKVVVITEDVQNVHLLLEYRPHIDVSLTCEHDPKLQEYCVCPQNMPQFDSEGIPNQAPETNKPMILNGHTSRNREGSDQPCVKTVFVVSPPRCVIVWLNATSLGGSGSELAARPVGFYFPPMSDSEEDILPLRSFTCFKTLLLSLAASALLSMCFPFHNSNTNTPLHAVIQTRKEAEIKPERIERHLSSLNQTTETSENRNCQSSEKEVSLYLQEDRDITYALFCSVLCIMEQILFDEIIILSVEENLHVYDKQRASYKDEKMKENTWLSIAASLNTDLWAGPKNFGLRKPLRRISNITVLDELEPNIAPVMQDTSGDNVSVDCSGDNAGIGGVYNSTLNDEHRTNNLTEDFHSRLQVVFGSHHPSFCNALTELQKEESDTKTMIVDFTLGRHVRAQPKREWLQLQTRMRIIVQDYHTYATDNRHLDFT